MKNLKIKLAITAAVAAFSTTGFSAGAAIAQDQQIELCPPGQQYEFVYECSRTTGQCVLVFSGCV